MADETRRSRLVAASPFPAAVKEHLGDARIAGPEGAVDGR
jgi:hypothetical protein